MGMSNVAAAGAVAGPREVIRVKAAVGDRLVVNATHVDGPTRDGEVVEVRGRDGGPPYLVRWSDGHEGLFFPGPDAVVRHEKG
jgi:Domain of unknown function (DUF1918)